MRIKKFTLLTLALVMSVVAFAQKPNSTNRVITPKRQLLQAKRTGELTKENVSAFKFAKPALPQNMQKARANKPVTNFNVKKLDANAIAQAKAKKVAKKSSNNSKKGFRQIDARSGYPSLTSSAMRRSNRAAEIDEHGIITAPGEGTVKVYKVTGSGYNYGDFVSLDGTTTKIVESTDGSVYIQDVITTYSRGVWVKGTKSGNTITVPAKQPLYYSSQYDATVSARWSTVSGTSVVPADDTAENFTFTVDETAQTISLNGTNETLILSALWDDDDTWSGYSVWETVYTYDHDYVAPSFVTVTPPAGLETTTWYTKGHTYSSGSTSGFKGTVSLGFDGNDVYVQGIFSDFPEAWVKGTIDGTTVTFKGLQVQGTYSGFTIYAVGTDGSGLTDFVMTYDAEKGILTSENELLANAAEDRIYYLTYITDLEINKNAPEDPRVTPPDGLVTETWTFAGYFYDGEDDTPTEKTLQIGFDGNDVYVQGIGNYMTEAWIKGTLSADGNSITFASGQYYGAKDDTYDMWFAVGDEDFNYLESVTVVYDAVAGTITWPEDIYIFENGAADEISAYGLYYDILIVRGTAPDPLEAPSGLETTEWQFTGLTVDEESNLVEYKIPVFVGFDGTDVWVKGLCEDLPDTWIKGTMSGNTVTFPTGQHFGTYAYWFWEFEYFFAGYGDGGYEDVVMNYDATAKTLTMTSPNFLLINAYWLLLDPNLYFVDAQIKEIPDVAATPAQPEITGAKLTGTSYPNVSVNIPLEDEDGNPILSDKLSYQYYYEIDHVQNPLTLTTDLYTRLTEDMTEIPYNFTDSYDVYNDQFYLNMDFSSWNKIGIQSIYRGGGEENRSEIFWYVIAPYMHNATFVAADEFSIQNGNATVKVDDNKIDVDSEGKAEIPEASTVTLNAAKGYVFVSATSSDATVTMAEDGLSASFEMPAKDVTVNYQVRELGKDIQFTSTNEFSIQGGQADLDINGDIVDLDASGLITDVAKGSTITLTADPAFKFTEVQATYIPKTTDPDPVINYTLTDSWGDGWNGGQVEIVKVSTGDVVATLTIESGASAEGSVDLEPGESYEINYTAGEYAGENSFVFTDAEGNEIASGSGSDGTRTLATYTAPAAPDPVDLDYTLASNGSTITFTVPNGNVSLTYTLEHRGVPVTIPAGKYVTYYSNEGTIVFDEGVQLMTVVSITDKTVNVEACDAIPALTPMLIYNSNGADTEAWIVSTDELGMTISNTVTVCDEFKGTLTEKTFTDDDMAAKDYYVCTGQDFVWVPNAGSIAANKCWLELSKDQPQSTRAIVIGDETTGIAGVSNKVVDGQWYDLNGRKLEQKPTAKGVYIVNGKKQVIK